MQRKIVYFLLVTVVAGCSLFPVNTLSVKKDSERMLQNSPLAEFANQYFWENFHKGNYHKLDSIFFYLLSAYNENPSNLHINAHLGFAHAWALSERNKLDTIKPDIIDHATLAVNYFGDAYQLNPNDPRVLGFLSAFKIIQGNISDDKGLIKQGYFNGLKSIHEWSEFNLFTVGYVLSQLPYDSWQFKKALEWQWKTLDQCYCEKFDRENPDIAKYLSLEETETDIRRKRACWNSWIAPHNVEGFFLNMGDMLVKSGDYKKGIQIYNLAKQAPQYPDWEFKELLEDRIANAEQNVENFRKKANPSIAQNDAELMLVNSSVTCMSCHKKSKEELWQQKDFDYNNYSRTHNIYWLNKQKNIKQ